MNTRVHAILAKKASSYGDAFRSIPATLIPYLGAASASAGSSIGTVEGISQDKPELVEKLKEFDEHPNRAFAPGVGVYRLTARKAMLQKLLEDKSNKDRATGTSRLVMDSLSLLNPLNLVAAPIAGLAAAVTKAQSLKDAADTANDENYGVKSLLIPGWNLYKRWKALGASNKISGMNYTEDEAKELDKETAKVLLAKLKEARAARKNDVKR